MEKMAGLMEIQGNRLGDMLDTFHSFRERVIQTSNTDRGKHIVVLDSVSTFLYIHL